MNKRNIIIIVSILVFVMIVGGVSYSYFVYNKDVGDVSLTAGEISIDLSGISGNKTLTNVIPITDNEGMIEEDYFDFTVNATVDTERIYYEVYLLPDSGNTLDTSYLKTYLTDQTNNVIKGITSFSDLSNSEVENGKVIYKGIIETNNGTTRTETKDFRLRLWLDESYTPQASKTFDFDIYLYAKNVDDEFIIVPEPCPGCKFMYLANNPMYTTWNTGKIIQTPTQITTGLYDNYQELMTATGRSYFLGVKLNNNNEVTNAYMCGVKNNVPFCIEGTSDGSKYTANQTLLQGANLWNNTCYVGPLQTGPDTYDDTQSQTLCGDITSGSLSADAQSGGNVSAGVGVDDYCYVIQNGYFGCSESAGG